MTGTAGAENESADRQHGGFAWSCLQRVMEKKWARYVIITAVAAAAKFPESLRANSPFWAFVVK
jgi:hypothetical protein